MMSIRRATPADSAALNALVQNSSAYDGHYRAILDGYRVSDEQIERDHVFVAELDSSIVGFYSLVLAHGQSELDLLFVADAAQGRGVGKVLMTHLKSFACKLGMETVKIVSHPPSLGFYLKMGALRAGVVGPRGRVTWERPLLVLPIPGA